MSETVLSRHEDGVTTITLNRGERHNAFDDHLIAELTAAFAAAGADVATRVVVLEAAGASFSAGADLGWMRRMADYCEADNLRDALALARLMETIDTCPKPTLAVVQGAAYGGGVGLVAACDMAVAATTASFCLSEVRLGLIPAVISPYVVAAMGARACRRYFLTAERFSAATAQALGLVQDVVEPETLAAARDALLKPLRQGGPAAQQAAKELIRTVAQPPAGLDVLTWTAQRIAATRAAPEGREGVQAFLDKRKPSWLGV